MELNIVFDYSELVSYFKGVYHHQGKPLDFTIVKIIDLHSKELIDLQVTNIDDPEVKGAIIAEFNKKFTHL